MNKIYVNCSAISIDENGKKYIDYDNMINLPTHQQRLDKVLEKFDKMNNDLYWALRWNEDFIDYMVGTNEFKFRGYTISLDTVEHLIKDMEAQDE